MSVLRGASDTELESITGYIVRLAAEHGVPAPYNGAIYRLGREKFRPGFEPLSCEEVLAAVERAPRPRPRQSVRTFDSARQFFSYSPSQHRQLYGTFRTI